MNLRPIRPDRIRRIHSGFAATPNRFLHGGFFGSLEPLEQSLYFFLTLAGDRQGMSGYGCDKICSLLGVPADDYIGARNALIDKDLIAFDGTRFQLLSLPPRPIMPPTSALTTQEDFDRDDPATIRQLIRDSLNER